MFKRQATIRVPLNVSRVFEFLKTRYDSQPYKDASMATKGYVPGIDCLPAEQNRSIAFSCRGRDPLLRIWVSGWSWGYDLSEISATETEVHIWYKYGFIMALLGAGTIGHQAANEICETAIALDALSRDKTAEHS